MQRGPMDQLANIKILNWSNNCDALQYTCHNGFVILQHV